jgi:hypothetical protein
MGRPVLPDVGGDEPLPGLPPPGGCNGAIPPGDPLRPDPARPASAPQVAPATDLIFTLAGHATAPWRPDIENEFL